MTQFNSFQYQEGENFQAVKLRYGEGFISMTVILPAKIAIFAEFLKSMTPEKWETWMNSFNEADRRLSLPRFTLRYENDLNDCLIAMGIKRAFTPAAEFPKMTSAPVMIGAVKHKTFVDVNEKGVEAAAVTAVLMAPTGAPPPQQKKKPFEMIVDRPFICAIRDERTGTLLFMGVVAEP